MEEKYGVSHMPDVLTCLADLSNDEVFTPPDVANAMLDLLPKEIWKSDKVKFLDPCCKTGVFLREITKRLLRAQMPGFDEQMIKIENKRRRHEELDAFENTYLDLLQIRLNHILKNQVYGIAITELTALMTRRTLYCAKDASSEFSVVQFDTSDGNIRYVPTVHEWEGKKGHEHCRFCGATKSELENRTSEETFAYEFIHTDEPERLFDMNFDVICSNPPYAFNDGGGTGSSAVPIYQTFIQQAKKLQPDYITMIIPARWFAGGRGLDEFRSEMLHDKQICAISDYFNAQECFPGVDISGGVCYFLWENNAEHELCSITSHLNGEHSTMERPLLEGSSETFIRFNQAVSIFRKVQAFKEKSFSDLVSPRKPFGLEAKDKIHATDNGQRYKVYAYPKNGYVDYSCVRSNKQDVDKYKGMISKAYGERGDFPYLIIGKPFIANPNEVCSETYLTVGSSDDKSYIQNIVSYMTTKFFRFFVLFKKNTQNAARGVYEFAPQQDFSKSWTDQELYEKYGLDKDEIAFIESMIRPMEFGE